MNPWLRAIKAWLLACAFSPASGLLAQEAEFLAAFTSLETVRSSPCSPALAQVEGTPVSLTDGQWLLFARAYQAATTGDAESLGRYSTDPSRVDELGAFIANLRNLVENGTGFRFMYQQAFDRNLSHHQYLAGFFSDSPPDVVVGIVFCQPRPGGRGFDQTGGYAYLTQLSGDWKFHSP